ncbi:glutamate--cysteine ligase [Natronocella acetinitrilica]|uniref:Glutamate--cysteine ligase n=1 Tax=Natronocella acetinitrilica TaxID=414046 RepID=A0AAE3G1G3_9GAMM|nr:glutamate--cysteine ligase [Natronocella acetinitrilica]MCP1673794.1 glutamate--cysteine ligase [Natronocella acetinitrilica]
MYKSSEKRVSGLQLNGERGLLRGSRKGMEKESLRVTADGTISSRPHPTALGSALTHPWITTDYSEALLEFITPPFEDVDDTLRVLADIHRFTYHNIDDEMLWATSMPCIVGGDASIPIAEYGSSNVGMMKHVYRRGLDWRYGRAMQAISGIHFNYSFSEAFLQALQATDGSATDPAAFRSAAYFGLIRNFQRYGWVIPFLFGASPAVCKSFTGGQNYHFQIFDDYTFYEPWGTSLRMSDIGYKNKAQAGLSVSYNDLDGYVDSLTAAISTPDTEYGRIGTLVDGEWRQLNTNILQIENEYYSFVRPKAVARSGEKPTMALRRAGVEYVEIRALDLNPFVNVGADGRELRFLETLLLFCLLQESPPIDGHELGRINCNQGLVARQGRDPDLKLYRADGATVPLRVWAEELMEALAGPAELLDELRDGTPYGDALRLCAQRVRDPGCTPSARVLDTMRDQGESFIEFAMRVSEEHRRQFLAEPLSPELRERFETAARESIAEQQAIEAADDLPFEDYLQRYFNQC